MGTWRCSTILYLQIRNFYLLFIIVKKDYPDLFYEKDTILYGVIPLESGEIQNETNNESKSGSRLDEKSILQKLWLVLSALKSIQKIQNII